MICTFPLNFLSRADKLQKLTFRFSFCRKSFTVLLYWSSPSNPYAICSEWSSWTSVFYDQKWPNPETFSRPPQWIKTTNFWFLVVMLSQKVWKCSSNNTSKCKQKHNKLLTYIFQNFSGKEFVYIWHLSLPLIVMRWNPISFCNRTKTDGRALTWVWMFSTWSFPWNWIFTDTRQLNPLKHKSTIPLKETFMNTTKTLCLWIKTNRSTHDNVWGSSRSLAMTVKRLFVNWSFL